MKAFQILVNVILYGFLAWLIYDSTVTEWDPWFAFVVIFVVFIAIVMTLMPKLHVAHTSPGSYPFEE